MSRQTADSFFRIFFVIVVSFFIKKEGNDDKMNSVFLLIHMGNMFLASVAFMLLCQIWWFGLVCMFQEHEEFVTSVVRKSFSFLSSVLILLSLSFLLRFLTILTAGSIDVFTNWRHAHEFGLNTVSLLVFLAVAGFYLVKFGNAIEEKEELPLLKEITEEDIEKIISPEEEVKRVLILIKERY